MIRNLRARVHEVPVTIPLLDDPIERRRFVTCEVELDDGAVGLGLTGQFLPHAVQSALISEFLPVVKGLDARNTEEIHDKIWKSLNPRTQTGVVSHALSALDIALWDARGKTSGRTIAELIGGHANHAESYITFGFPEYDRDELVAAARLQVDKGFARLKLVVGVHKDGWAEDARRIRAVREAIGDDVELMIDANYMFNPVEALLLCRGISDYNITWFEEPLHQNDARALADLRTRTSIPVAAGQMDGHRWRLRELVDRHAVDILQPNVCYCGGYTEAVKVAHLAQAFNLPVANGGGWPHFNMHLYAGVLNGWRVEFHLGMTQVGNQIFPDAPAPADDRIVLPSAPGLGMKVDHDFLDETQIGA